MHAEQKKIVRSTQNINIAIFLCLYLDTVCRQSISIEASELKRWVDDTETKAVNRHAKLFAQLAACLRDIQLSLLHSSFMCVVPRYGCMLDAGIHNDIKRCSRGNGNAFIWSSSKCFVGSIKMDESKWFSRARCRHWWWIYSLMKSKMR